MQVLLPPADPPAPTIEPQFMPEVLGEDRALMLILPTLPQLPPGLPPSSTCATESSLPVPLSSVPVKLTPSGLLFQSVTMVNPKSLFLGDGNEWIQFVNLQNMKKWKATDMEPLDWIKVANTFNSMKGLTGNNAKHVDVFKKALTALEKTVFQQIMMGNYNSMLL